MYQAQITKTETGAPVTFRFAVADIVHALGGASLEPFDVEEGIWLIGIDHYNSDRLERDGYLAISIYGYTVEIEMP